MQDIIDHSYDGTGVKEQDTFIMAHTGTKCHRETTKGFDLLFQWKDGRKIWVTLKDMKNSYPVQMAEYTVRHCIAGNPEFEWSIRHVLEKRNRMIGNLKSKYWVRTHKFGVNIHKSVQEAKEFDK